MTANLELDATGVTRCRDCGAVFDNPEEAGLHLRSHPRQAPASDNEGTQCPDCKVNFATRLDFEQHLQLAHTGSRKISEFSRAAR